MADETQQDVQEETPVTMTGVLSGVKQEIAARVDGKAINPAYTKFVDQLVDEKVNQRAGSLLKCHQAVLKHSAEINKIRPKSPGFGEDMKPLPKVYTGEDIKKLQELREKIAKLSKAATAATAVTATEKEWKDLDDVLAKAG